MFDSKRRYRNGEPTGDLLTDFAEYLDRGFSIAILPISRIHIEWLPIECVDGVVFYPPGSAELEPLNVVANRTGTKNLAELASAYSGVDVELLNDHTLVAFPYRFDWNKFCACSHKEPIEFIRTLSEYVDGTCLNVIKFNFCRFGLTDTIPGRAGSVISNPMMAGALLYSHESREGRIVGGSVFSHAPVMGLGLELESLEGRCFPRDGEVGK